MGYAKVKKAADKLAVYPGKKQLHTLLGPVVEPVAAKIAGRTVQRLLGFWVLWHTYGGDFAGLIDAGVLSRAGVYNQRNDFAAAFGCQVEDWQPELAEVLRASSVADLLGHAPKRSDHARAGG